VKGAPRVLRIDSAGFCDHPTAISVAELDELGAVVVVGALDAARVKRWSHAVRRAQSEWVADFDAEQHSLGRAFYTHYETGRAELYFRTTKASDETVERHLPGMQAWVLGLLASLTGGTIRQRMGFCGPGVHVFPAGGQVAKHGGVVHYDVEGLSPLCLSQQHRALSLVVMLEPVAWGGGLRLWGVRYHGTQGVTAREAATPHTTVRYGPGDALLMSSYRLHQIRPFRGKRDRLSITLHAQEVDNGVFEAWF